jgi:hypothetical protein
MEGPSKVDLAHVPHLPGLDAGLHGILKQTDAITIAKYRN